MHQVGTSSLLIYMMHGHTYIKCGILSDINSRELKIVNTQASESNYKIR